MKWVVNVKDPDGFFYAFHSGISFEQQEFMRKFVAYEETIEIEFDTDNNTARVLEVIE